MPGAGSELLAVRAVHKRFGGVHALRGVDFDVRAGEVHALVGENGAGKSTIINILAGAFRPDSGEIRLDGAAVDFRSPSDSQRSGIAVIHQELTLLPTLGIAENIFVGRMPSRGGWVDRRSMTARAATLLAEVGLDADPDTRASELSASQQQLVEIAKALSRGARLLIMDEPTASLTEHEASRLLSLVRRLRDGGTAIIYVTHRLAEVFAIAERVTVLRDGQSVGTIPASESSPALLVGMMVGRPLASRGAQEPAALGQTMLEVRRLSRGSAVRDVSFAVRCGEVVGMAGLAGAGRSETARLIFGAEQPDSGMILLAGREVRFRSPRDARRAGIGMVPEDRKHLALFMDKPVGWNITMAELPALSRWGVIRSRIDRSLAESFVDKLQVRTPGIDVPVRQLSGGNQQKTVLARWLATRPSVLVLDEPTHGVDVGAKAEIYVLIRELARAGMAILLISSELPEVLDLSDRIVVMREGRVATIVERADATEQTVMMHATGAA